ncbi:hypothetical protein HY990_07445 [Candidatus Micrarchaeota archaeon]|nr:hypothetical protein [Candidatus Micrarchaeota archaeon]
MIALTAASFASPYEWLRNLSEGGAKISIAGLHYEYTREYNVPENFIEWYPTTSSNFSEYRALWINNSGTWERITQCSFIGNISGNATDICRNVTWNKPAGTYNIRVSINWEGCMGFDPNPGPYCGDYYDYEITIREGLDYESLTASNATGNYIDFTGNFIANATNSTNVTNNISWNTNVPSPYSFGELMSVYLKKDGVWTQLPECGQYYYSTGLQTRNCSNVLFTDFTPGFYYGVASVQAYGYECGTSIQPFPNQTCGDYRMFNLTLD